MYTIKQASSRSGVPVQLIRAWERRYGAVEPARTESGYRLYDEQGIARLRAMRVLVDEGWTPSNAAQHVRALDDAGVATVVERGDALPQTPAATPDDADGRLRRSFVDAAAVLDEARLEQTLDEMFARGSFEHVMAALVLPALVDLGQAWADGRVDVAGEHAASGAVQRRLGTAFMAAGAPREDAAPVLVGLPPGARHDLGALAFATAARRAGIAVRYLGADLPVQDWVEAVERTGARAVVIGVVVKTDVRSAAEVARAVVASDADLIVAFGGHRAAAAATGELSDAIVLPEEVTSSVETLRAALSPAS